MEVIAGWRKRRWCRENVFVLIEEQFIIFSILKAFAGNRPENKIEAEINRFPEGTLLMNG